MMAKNYIPLTNVLARCSSLHQGNDTQHNGRDGCHQPRPTSNHASRGEDDSSSDSIIIIDIVYLVLCIITLMKARASSQNVGDR